MRIWSYLNKMQGNYGYINQTISSDNTVKIMKFVSASCDVIHVDRFDRKLDRLMENKLSVPNKDYP